MKTAVRRDSGANDIIKLRRIEMPYLADHADDDSGEYVVVRENSRQALIRIYNILGKQFLRETGFDFGPYMDDRKGIAKRWTGTTHEQAGVLIADDSCIAWARLISGVIGLTRPIAKGFGAPGPWTLHWLYVHPYMRGKGLIEDAWTHAVVPTFGPVQIIEDHNNKPAGKVLLRKLLALSVDQTKVVNGQRAA
jgi:hypothetical protein